jgi:hypothetical protein
MNILDKQLFEANFTAIAEQFIKWKEAKPENKTLDSLAQCLYEMYSYTNSLQIREMVLEKQIKKLKDDNFNLRTNANGSKPL